MNVSLDRAATVRQAETLLRQGKLEQAIAEYVRMVEDQPRDWNTANLLGDLFVRAGQIDPAIAQFSRIADALASEGFVSKAAALYKKILKLRPDEDTALMKAGELAAEQGLLADARSFFTAAADTRRQRGDGRGALEIAVRVGALNAGDVDARMRAARARIDLDDVTGGLKELHDLASMLIEQQRDADALVPLREIARLDPADAGATQDLVRILLAQGAVAEASAFLTADAVGTDPRLMLAALQFQLPRGVSSSFELVDRLLAADPLAAEAVSDLALALPASQSSTAYAVIDRVVEQAVAEGDFDRASMTLRSFIERCPHDVPALTRLVEVAVDGGSIDATIDAQGLLADAYLATGAAAEARYLAEDLVTRQPWARVHYNRLRQALAVTGESDPDGALAEWLAAAPTFGVGTDPFSDDLAAAPAPSPSAATADAADEPARSADAPAGPLQPASAVLRTGAMPDTVEAVAPPPQAAASPPPSSGSSNPHAIDLDLIFGKPAPPVPPRAPSEGTIEEDLSRAVDGIRPTAGAASVNVSPAASPAPTVPTDIEAVFAQMRERAAHLSTDQSAEVALTRGIAMVEAGQLDESIEQLRHAMRSPQRRFAAASLLSRVFERQQRLDDAIQWLGHAVDAPGVSHVERFDALFRMASLLETTGQAASALAICLELQSEAGNYRDLDIRIERLLRAQGGG